MLLAAACDPAVGSRSAASVQPSETIDAPVPTGAASADARASESVGATLRWAVRSPVAIVPWAVVDASGLLIVDTVFDSLTAVTAAGAVRPAAAVRWQSFDGARRWRFTLRPDARFHDGTPVTAGDFVRGWSMTVRRGVTGSHLIDVVGYRDVRAGRTPRLAGVRAVDDRTLEVRLVRPTAHLPAVVAHPSLAPAHPGVADGDDFASQPIGNGPFSVVEPWAQGQFVRVARAARWRNGPQATARGRIGEIVFRTLAPEVAYVGFQQGRIDVAPIPAGALGEARSTFGQRVGRDGPGVVDGPLPTLYHLGVRVDTPPFDDVDVRRALSRAIDRRALAAGLPDRGVDVARSIVPPVLRAGTAVSCDACLHIPSWAASTFADAGVDELTITYDRGGGHEPVVDQLRRDLAAVGVTLTTRALPFGEYLAALEAGELTLFRFGWQAQDATPGAMLEAVVRGGAPVERGDAANYTGYASSTVDELLDRARASRSDERRALLWAEAEERALDDMPVIPLFFERQRIVVSERVRRLELTPWGTATPELARVVDDPARSDDSGP